MLNEAVLKCAAVSQSKECREREEGKGREKEEMALL